MRWWQRLLDKSRAEHQLDAELRFHIEQQIADYLAAGMAPDEARRRARQEFGGLDQVKEDCHQARRGYFLETLLADLRYGLRMLRKSPAFTAAALITLALGIGANTAIFSMVDALLLRPLPVRDPGELRFLAFPRDASHFEPSFSFPEFRQIRDRAQGLFSQTSAMVLGGLSGQANQIDGLTVDGITRPAQTLFVTGNFFQMLGIRPYLGRLILPSEGNTPGGDPVVVLSYRYWKRRFHGDPNVVNKPALIDGRAVTIVGVGPKGFLGPTPIIEMEAYLPLAMMTVEAGEGASFPADPARHDLLVVARLSPAVTSERVNSVLRVLGQELAKEYPRPGLGTALEARPLRPPGFIDGPNPLPVLAGLFSMLAGLVLGLAILNVANLSLVRAAGRQREMAVRAALGGSRTRLIRHLLSETMLVALAGAAAGIVVGNLALRALSSRALAATDLPLVFEFPFNARVFMYGLAVAALSAAMAGIVPALRVSRGNLNNVLHDGGRGSTGRKQRTRTALVALEVGGSLALLIVAALFVRSLESAQHSDLGFDPRNVLNVRLDPGEIGYTDSQGVGFYRQILARVRTLPGVQSTSLATIVPLGDSVQGDEIAVPGYVPRRGEHLNADDNAVSPDYFKTMKIPVLQGREFSDFDTESSRHVAVINQAMAERFWHGTSALGRAFQRQGDPQHTIEIVGVVKNSRTEDPYSPYTPAFYVPIAQSYSPVETLQIRTAGPPEAIASEILSIVRSVAPMTPVVSIRTMTDAVANGANGLLLFNLAAQLSGALGFLGLVLAVVGIYGVTAYAVGQRTQEIGLRLALGAQRTNILWMIARQGLMIVGIGLAIGLAITTAAARLVGDFLVGVAPTDALTYSTVSLLLISVALAACYFPARRALEVDPIIALRQE
jgi:predicted permease